jgi:predicted transcriptional regulator
MPTAPARQASRLFTVRLDPAVRERLDALAATSDRSLAQLVRYALTSPGVTVTATACSSEPGTSGVHTTVRIPAPLAQTIDAQAAQFGVTASDVIRASLASWVVTADPAALGAPLASIEVTA